jgi:YHS domain-containing protein
MNNITRIILTVSALVFSSLGALSFYYAAQDYVATGVIYSTDKNIAINGYDTVSYFDKNGPTIGNPDFEVEWAGTKWFFTSRENRDKFAKSPDTYAPQFGGYDPVGIAQGYTNPSTPEHYIVFARQLFLFYTDESKVHWDKDRGTNMVLAQSNWAFIRETLLKGGE